MSDTLRYLNNLSYTISRIFFPLTELENEDDVLIFFRKIGIDVGSVPTVWEELISLIGESSNIVDSFENGDENTDNREQYKEIYELIINSIEIIRRFSEEASNLSSLSAKVVFRSLLDYLFCLYLREEEPIIYEFFILFEIIKETEKILLIDGEEYVFQDLKVDYSRVFTLVIDPLQMLKEVYGWDSENINISVLTDRISDLLAAFDIVSDLDTTSSSINSVLGVNARSLDIDDFTDYNSSVLETKISLGDGCFTLQLYALYSEDGIKCDGFAIGVDYPGEYNKSISLYDDLKINMISNASVNNGIGIAFRKNKTIKLYHDLLVDDRRQLSESSGFSFLVDLLHNNDDEHSMLLGYPNGSSLSIGSTRTSIGVLKSPLKPLDIFIELQFSNCEIIITAENGDGFVSKLLGDEKIKVILDFGVGWSHLSKMYFCGSADLDVVIPMHAKLGPIAIESIFLKAEIDGEIINISMAGSFWAKIGPISVSINRMGLISPFAFSPNMTGNFGPADVKNPLFLPPAGAGLAIDAGAIAGGGYLDFDDPNKRYAGNLQLQAGSIGLVATGLITTRLPDGSDGFALLVNIGVEFMPPIQLSFGFMLSGVGGLLGYNRTMKVDVLREGLRSRTLDSILFSEDPIANAPKIISDLRAVFPPQEGRFVVGPIVKIGWGSPNIIQADIGIFIELPGPVRVVLLGQIAAALPKADKAIVELHIDVLGVIEFDKQLLSIDATLYDSRIYEYPLTGDAALRLSWGDAPVFAMSLGGFHPRFSPPPNFPALRRLTLNLSQGSALQLYCRAYQALTSNSLQFGARVDLFAKKGGATVEGNLSFDALIYFSPFSFVVAISGNVVARFKGHKLTGVHLSLTLSGPTPWNARGRASFEILWLDLSVTFNKTWGPRQPVTIEAMNPWSPLKDALEDNDSWGSRLPDRNGMVEMLAEMDEDKGAAPPLILHPAGSLEIRQKVLPLGIRLDKLGNAPVKDHYKFEITNIGIEDETLDLAPVEEYFARGQFINLSDSERLSRPSFEKMKAGVAASSDRLAFKGGWVQPADLTYESILIQEDRTSKMANFKDKATLDWRVANRQLFGNAARRSGLRTTGRRKFETQGKAKQVGVVREGYTLVNNADMSPVGVPGNNGTIGLLQAEQLLSEYLQSKPGMAGEVEIVPSFEVAA